MRVLNDALHDLHHRAGWPSLRALARETGVSHTTVSKAFSRPALPSWGTLELLVEAMDGPVAEVHRLWLAASAPADSVSALPIAGRREEVAAVRRHLENGSGLLLVTGEAGIGKTTVISTAVAGCERRVLTASARRLSTDAPFLPVTALLRAARDADDGDWFDAALARCPGFVPTALVPVLPELADATGASTSDEATRSQLLDAVGLVVQALDGEHPVAVWVEDLHWCDPDSLDVVEVLAADTPAPIVASWRTEDPEVDGAHAAWWARAARSAVVVPLGPLDQDDTIAQLALQLGAQPDPRLAAEVHRRGAGIPLYTEQLAAADGADGQRPPLLDGIIASRLVDLDDRAWRVARALGVADRPLTPAQLRTVTAPDDPSPGLRTLGRRHLLAHQGDGGLIELRHPLIAEAVRRRLAPGEAATDHERLARILMASAHPPAADVARHWQAVGDVDLELEWQLRAGNDAGLVWAMGEAHRRAVRVLELWPHTTREPPLGVSHAKAHLAVIETALLTGHPESEVRRLIDTALAADLPRNELGPIISRAADVELSFGGDAERGLRLLDEAVDLMQAEPPPFHPAPDYVDTHPLVLEQVYSAYLRVQLRLDDGRFDAAMNDARWALGVATGQGHDGHQQSMTGYVARIDALQGRVGDAITALEAARARPAVRDAQPACIRLAASESAVLLIVGAPLQDILAATEEATIQIRRFTWITSDELACNLGTAMLRAGAVDEAERLVGTYVQGPAGGEPESVVRSRACHVRALTRQGRYTEAAAVPHDPTHWARTSTRAFEDVSRAEVDLWTGRPDRASTRLRRALDGLLPTDWSALAAEPLLLAARAHADLVEQHPADPRTVAAELRDLRSSAATDPLGPDAVGADVPASAATWRAELTRAAGRSDLRAWVDAAACWDDLHRPHDAAYCRWRAGQAGLRDGRGTVAQRLLARAATDAHQHVPLSDAIASTRVCAR